MAEAENGLTPVSDLALKEWPKFTDKAWGRLEQGRIEYGDKSFARPVLELVGEVEQEILDQVGWSFIGWCKLQDIRRKLEQILA